tara:strand:+ start:35100 stop:35753 length:654 start_codon:yes stop_codon:yes gene_type:complete
MPEYSRALPVPLEQLLSGIFLLSPTAITFDILIRSKYSVIVPGSTTNVTTSTFILFETQQDMLDNLTLYGSRFIVDKYSNVSHENLDAAVEGLDLFSAITQRVGVSWDISETYLALAIQEPFRLEALPGGVNTEYVITKAPEAMVGPKRINSMNLFGSMFNFLYTCSSTSLLCSEEGTGGEEMFTLRNVLNECNYQLMHLNNECALGCSLCNEGVNI